MCKRVSVYYPLAPVLPHLHRQVSCRLVPVLWLGSAALSALLWSPFRLPQPFGIQQWSAEGGSRYKYIPRGLSKCKYVHLCPRHGHAQTFFYKPFTCLAHGLLYLKTTFDAAKSKSVQNIGNTQSYHFQLILTLHGVFRISCLGCVVFLMRAQFSGIKLLAIPIGETSSSHSVCFPFFMPAVQQNIETNNSIIPTVEWTHLIVQSGDTHSATFHHSSAGQTSL